jgi:hypothetical protein
MRLLLGSLHFPVSSNHFTARPSSVFSHVDGKKQVTPHHGQDNERIEGIKANKKIDSSNEKIEDHREELKRETIEEGVQRAAFAQCTHDFANAFAEMKVQR